MFDFTKEVELSFIFESIAVILIITAISIWLVKLKAT